MNYAEIIYKNNSNMYKGILCIYYTEMLEYYDTWHVHNI